MDTRISHIIPTITCSSCQMILPIRDLPHHICEVIPTKPKLPLTLDTTSPLMTRKEYKFTSNVSPTENAPVPGLMKSVKGSSTTYRPPQTSSSSPPLHRQPTNHSIHKNLQRTQSTESNRSTSSKNNSNETWKIARRPTGSSIKTTATSSSSLASPLSALSRSFSIESATSSPSSSSPLTPPVDQRPYLSFRVAATPKHPKQQQQQTELLASTPLSEETATTTISFFKMPSSPRPPPSSSSSSSSTQPTPATTIGSSKLANHYHQFLHNLSSSQHNSCTHCKRRVRDDPIRTGSNHVYHRQCLKCFLCRDPLDPHKEVLEHNGIAYCPKDYQFIHSRPSCATCHESIDPPSRPIEAFGAYYHPEHLRCAHCDRTVDHNTTGIVRHKKKVYCRTDFNLLFLPKCRGCKRAVERESVSSSDGKLQGKWHKHCFRCQACQQPFLQDTFYVYQNQPYCQRDYHRLNHSLCAKCDMPIEGRCAQTTATTQHGADKYHPQCFTCAKCNIPIKDIYYSDQQHAIYCPAHGLKHGDKRTTIFCEIPLK